MTQQNIPETSEFITFRNSQGIVARGTLLKSSENHIVFETYNPYSVVQFSEVINNVNIYRFNKLIYTGKAVVSNLINTGLLLVVSATLVDSWIDGTKSGEILNIESEAKKFTLDWNNIGGSVLPSYQLSVNKIRSFLSDSNRWVRQFNISIDEEMDGHKISEQGLINKVSGPLLSYLQDLFLDFEEESKKVESSKINLSKRFAQQELHPLMMQSPFAYRTFHKPLGYAGDYEMVNMMFRNPYEGESVYAKILNSFLLGPGPAESHRNRIEILLERITAIAHKAKLEGRRANIFNFACGPAIEIQKFIDSESISENCNFILLDFSKETLDYTKNKLEESKSRSGFQGVNIEYVHKSVNDVLRDAIKSRGLELHNPEGFDLIYCAGLFDYLSDRVCQKLLSLFFSKLRSDGTLLATNVHMNNPAKGLMEHLLDWYLVYRDNDDFANLFKENEKEIYLDDSGYNVFLETRKTS